MRVEPTGSPPPMEATPRRFVRSPAQDPAEAAAPRDAAHRPDRTPRFEARSSLKFNLSAADVDAKFEIHEPTSTLTVTMYERQTGEVLREVPNRHVLDVIASVAASGLNVDTTS